LVPLEGGCFASVENCADGCTDPEICDECDDGYYGEKCLFDDELLEECETCLFSTIVASTGQSEELNNVSATSGSTSS